jgi:hypothetical protein
MNRFISDLISQIIDWLLSLRWNGIFSLTAFLRIAQSQKGHTPWKYLQMLFEFSQSSEGTASRVEYRVAV